MKIIVFEEKSGKQLELGTETEKSLLALLQEQQIYVDAPCNGKGNCGRCHVRFLEGIPEPTEKEKRLLSETELAAGIRLACAALPKKDCRIMLLSENSGEIAALAKGGREIAPREEKGTVSGEGENEAAPLQGRKKTMPLQGGKENYSYGIAVDIGTTTLAAELVELKSGAKEAVATSVNHQRAYGADVISRIQAANEGKGALLQYCIRTDIKALMVDLVKQAGISREQVEKIVIAGNTTMCHLLRGLSCEGLGAAPFTPTDISLWEGTAGELLGDYTWNAKAVILPGISAFVGADIVAGIYSSGMDLQEKACLLLDIGTNGEMVIGGKEGFLVTSAAAGPVFEGGNISCGVPGIPGAVTHVSLQRKGGSGMPDFRETESVSGKVVQEWEEKEVFWRCYETIGGKPPVGICGTGIIDVASELVREGLVDENGTLAEPWFAGGFPVAGDAVRFTQRDIREIQMGKSAIRAGMETLLLEYQKKKPEAGEPKAGESGIPVFLAGGFGYYMDVEKAIRIGLFPEFFSGQVKAIGNSALEGAKQFLLAEEEEAKGRMQWIVEHAREINLAMHPKFNDLYMEHMFF